MITGGGIIGGVDVELAIGGRLMLTICEGTPLLASSAVTDVIAFDVNDGIDTEGVETMLVNTAAETAIPQIRLQLSIGFQIRDDARPPTHRS